MKLSVNGIKSLNEQYGSAPDPAPNGVDDLVNKIGSQLGAIEEVISIGEKYNGALIVRVIDCHDHPNADRLHLCKVDDGGKFAGANRDEDGHIQVVCGAPNVHSGMLAVWLPPGTTVPASYGQTDPFVMEARSIRGEVSNGMMASPKELGLGDLHEGILEVTDDIAPGAEFAEVYHLKGDFILDIENKMFTHRPDCFGWLGLAREIAGIYGNQYASPDWYKLNPEIPAPDDEALPINIQNEIPDLVPRFVAICLSDVQIKQSPVQVQVDLARAGIRPINNVVDLTNLVMMITGQPIHAYDYDKVKKLSSSEVPTIIIRHPKENEQITLLNGKTITPRSDAMMVATDQKLICLGGAMGGSETEVDENSKNIIIEAANWDMYTMRRTSMASGVFTDAITRFTKGQSPLQNPSVALYIAAQMKLLCSAKISSKLYDDNHVDSAAQQRGNIHPEVSLSAEFINVRLGLSLSADQVAKILSNVEFKVMVDGDNLKILAPFWRTDIAIAEDIVEEVGRLYGYDKLPLVLPKRDISPATRNKTLDKKSSLRQVLSSLGSDELLTYNFVHGRLLDQVGQDRDKAFRISNALSPDLQYYRMSLLPSLLEKVHPNIKSGNDKFAIFEINKVHRSDALDKDNLPEEFERLALVFAVDDKVSKGYVSDAYYEAKLYLDGLRNKGLIAEFELEPLTSIQNEQQAVDSQTFKPFEPARAAAISIDGQIVGAVGEFRSSVRRSLKLPKYVSGFEIDITYLNSYEKVDYRVLSKYPKIEQDICLRVSNDVSYEVLLKCVSDALSKNYPDKRQYDIKPIDIFQKETDKDHKQVTFRLSMASYERTLTDKEINLLLDEVAAKAEDELHAERI